MAQPPTRFVFSPALYPGTPLTNTPVFTHGKIIEIMEKSGELLLKVQDEKGTWSAYTERDAALQDEQTIRAYGLIVSQPDGNVMLAAKWVKRVEKDEYAYCEREARKEWEKLIETYPTLATLTAYTIPERKNTRNETPTRQDSRSRDEESDFIPATEFKVDKEYIE